MVTRGPARQRRRRAVRDRSRAVPHRGDAGRGKLASVRTDFANLKTNLRLDGAAASRSRARPSTSSSATSTARTRCSPTAPARRPTSTTRIAALVTAKTQLEQLEQQQEGDPQPAARRSRPADREISALRAGRRRARPGASAISTTPCCARRSPAWRRRSTSIQLGRYVTAGTPVFSLIDDAQAVGRRQPEGNRHHASAHRPAGDDLGRHVPGPHLPRHGRGGQPRHRRAVRDPAAAERERKLGQGGAARAGAHRVRRRRGRARPARRHERRRSTSTPAGRTPCCPSLGLTSKAAEPRK